jgi:hypothetical protein
LPCAIYERRMVKRIYGLRVFLRNACGRLRRRVISMPPVRRLLVLLLALFALVATLAAAGSASRTSAPPFGALRIDSFAGIENLDPSRAYYWFDWQRLDATCATLLTYPDAPLPANTRLQHYPRHRRLRRRPRRLHRHRPRRRLQHRRLAVSSRA